MDGLGIRKSSFVSVHDNLLCISQKNEQWNETTSMTDILCIADNDG